MYNDYFLNKIVLVTGAGSGIGRDLCQKLSMAGATVICSDIDMVKASETTALIGRDCVTGRQLDVTQIHEVESLIQEVVKRYGRIDIVFNNAGIAITGELRDMGMDDWKKIIDVNFYGVLYGSQTAYRFMREQGSGQIVNTASLAGLVDHLAGLAPYSVTKHAVVNYTKILRMEANAFGIKANVICPGVVSTPIGKNSPVANAKQSWSDNIVNEVAKGISPDAAAGYILKGVAANKEVIFFTFKDRAVLLLTTLFKGLFKMEMKRRLKDYRENYRVN
jgi:NAD(P)-dependent dehydrogenase (short-subunit alcohol dehydrogenase family)